MSDVRHPCAVFGRDDFNLANDDEECVSRNDESKYYFFSQSGVLVGCVRRFRMVRCPIVHTHTHTHRVYTQQIAIETQETERVRLTKRYLVNRSTHTQTPPFTSLNSRNYRVSSSRMCITVLPLYISNISPKTFPRNIIVVFRPQPTVLLF